MNDNKNSFSYQVMKEQEERLKKALEQRNNKINEYDKIVEQLEKRLKKFSRVYNVDFYYIKHDPNKWQLIIDVAFRYYGEFRARYSYEVFESMNIDVFWGEFGLKLANFIDEREVELYENN